MANSTTHQHKSNTKRIWYVFIILSVVTIFEVFLGIIRPEFLTDTHILSMKFVRKKFNADLGSQLGLTGINRVIVQFKIDKSGNVTDVRSRAPHPRLEEEAARVINSLPKMQPGKQRGKPVGVMYSLPIVFQVQD